MTTRYDYKVYCRTESKWVEGTTRSAVKPTTCFNNNSHAIEPTATTLTGTVSPQVVTLAEEETATNGNYKCDGVAFTAAAAVDGVPTVTSHDIKYPFAVNLMSASACLDDSHAGNSIDIKFVPDSVIGGTTQIGGMNSDSTILVAAIALPNFLVGLTATASDGQGDVALGTVVSVDANTNQIIMSGDPARAVNKGNTVTLSYTTQTGALTEAALAGANSFAVTAELAAAVVIGVNVVVAGQPVGTVGSVVDQVITVTGSLTADVDVDAAVVLSYTSFTTLLLEDVLPLNTLEVSDTCLQCGQVGMNIKITADGVNLTDMGRIVSIDKATKRIEVETPPTASFPPGSYILVTRYYIQNHEFGGRGTYNFSTGRNKGSYVEKGKIGRILYTNHSAVPVRFAMKLEYLH